MVRLGVVMRRGVTVGRLVVAVGRRWVTEMGWGAVVTRWGDVDRPDVVPGIRVGKGWGVVVTVNGRVAMGGLGWSAELILRHVDETGRRSVVATCILVVEGHG